MKWLQNHFMKYDLHFWLTMKMMWVNERHNKGWGINWNIFSRWNRILWYIKNLRTFSLCNKQIGMKTSRFCFYFTFNGLRTVENRMRSNHWNEEHLFFLFCFFFCINFIAIFLCRWFECAAIADEQLQKKYHLIYANVNNEQKNKQLNLHIFKVLRCLKEYNWWQWYTYLFIYFYVFRELNDINTSNVWNGMMKMVHIGNVAISVQ